MSRLVAKALIAAAVGIAPGQALACGGCFGPPNTLTPTVVTGHRMAFAVSETQTVLWDQFQYEGDPEDFSWVLPVLPGAYVELASDAWLSALDAFTSPVVVPQPLNCVSAGGGCACGGMSADDASTRAGGPYYEPGVTVVRQERVGPYDTVVLSSEDPDALRAWLTGNGYAIPEEIQPVIDAYVDEGNDFLALRLAPGLGVQQMEPVRVITPGGDYLLPLRMVAAGVGSVVDIKLFVIAEGRYMMPDLAEVSLPLEKLGYDWLDSSSNYLELRNAALAQNSGKSYLVPYARQQGLWRENTRPDTNFAQFYRAAVSGGASSSAPQVSRLAELYFSQAAVDDGVPLPNCSAQVSRLTESAVVYETCAGDAPCEPQPLGALPDSDFTCGEYSDLSTALVGMHPDRVWVTRMEMNLPSTALDADCIVEPAVAQAEIGPFFEAEKTENPPCDAPLFSAGVGAGAPALWLATALVWRRRSRRRAPSP